MPLRRSFYFVSGLRYGGGDASGVAGNIAPLLAGLDTSFRISPVSLIPILVMVVCIVIKFPAIPAVMAGVVSGLIVAVAAQGMPFGDIFTIGFSGYVGHIGVALLDELLTAGGIESMMHANSIVIIAMAYGGLMQKTGQIEALVSPARLPCEKPRRPDRTHRRVVRLHECYPSRPVSRDLRSRSDVRRGV